MEIKEDLRVVAVLCVFVFAMMLVSWRLLGYERPKAMAAPMTVPLRYVE